MANEDIRCIIKCVISFQDGNCEPSEIQKGEVLDVTEAMFHRLSKSGPKHFELVERKFLKPKKKEVVPEGVAFATLNSEVDADPNLSQEYAGSLPVEEWAPIGWYAAQLAREPKDEEA